MTTSNSKWSEWINSARVVAPDELSFYARDGVVVVVLRDEPLSKSRIRNATYIALLFTFAVIALICVDQILMQLLLLCLVLVGLYAYTARTRISIETTPLCLVAETRHFGRITHRRRIYFQSDARFIARPVGGYQNIDNELVFADQTNSHFCLYVTNPNDFDHLLSELNAAVRHADATVVAHSQSPP